MVKRLLNLFLDQLQEMVKTGFYLIQILLLFLMTEGKVIELKRVLLQCLLMQLKLILQLLLNLLNPCKEKHKLKQNYHKLFQMELLVHLYFTLFKMILV
ncbi:MAG: hypothetical protein CMF74_16740 [Maricaulis sp.]|nr:hypothetical protein [Maricaulis sp.]